MRLTINCDVGYEPVIGERMDTPKDPQQAALFQIEGPDEDGCVWICSTEGREVWCHNLGPEPKVAEVMLRWLGAVHVNGGGAL
jgi:hypothetical protein